MYLETIDEKAFRSFLSNPAISVLDGNVLDKHHNSDFYRFVRVPLSDGEHSVEALFGQMCSNYPTSMSKNHFYEQHNLEFMAYVVDHEKTYAESYEFLRLFDVTSAYTGPHSAMGEMTKTLWDYLEQKTILDPDYLNTPELQNEAYENAVKQYVLQKKDTAFEESLRNFLEHIDDTATIEFFANPTGWAERVVNVLDKNLTSRDGTPFSESIGKNSLPSNVLPNQGCWSSSPSHIVGKVSAVVCLLRLQKQITFGSLLKPMEKKCRCNILFPT